MAAKTGRYTVLGQDRKNYVVEIRLNTVKLPVISQVGVMALLCDENPS